MTRCRPIRLRLGLCALFVSLVLPALGSAQLSSVDTSKPFSVQGPSRKIKADTFSGQVLFVTPQVIQVRSRENAAQVRSFSYTAAVSAQMARLRGKGGYRYGDRVKIMYAPGSDVALRIKGKPSKAG
jgi:hypothetical protein